jgi:hypothetical protein
MIRNANRQVNERDALCCPPTKIVNLNIAHNLKSRKPERHT